MPKHKGKKETINLIDVLTGSDKYVQYMSKRTRRSPATNFAVMYPISKSPLYSEQARTLAKEEAKRSGAKVAGKIIENALKDYFS